MRSADLRSVPTGRTHVVLLAGLCVAAAACGGRAELIDTRVYVARPPGRDPDEAAVWTVDEQAVRTALRAGVERLRRLWGSRGTAASQPGDEGGDRMVYGRPATEADLRALFDAMAHGPIDELAGPAGRLRRASPALLEPVARRLLRPRSRPKSEYRTVLGLIGGDVPNRYGTFLLHWKKRHGYRVHVSEDWYADLLALQPARVGRALRPVLRDCIETVALLWAVADMGRTSPDRADRAVAVLLDAAYVHYGTFRDEVARALRSMGDTAVPALVEASKPPERPQRTKEGERAARKAAFAAHVLDTLGRGHPARALDAFADRPAALSRLLDAYARRRSPEAAEGIVARVDHADPRVRAAARAAVRAYLAGPPPRVRRRTVRLLGGRTETRRAEVDHRTRMALALRRALSEVAPESVEPACSLRRNDGTVDETCAAQPRRHAAALFAAYDRRRADRRTALLASLDALPDDGARRRALDRALVADPALAAEPEALARILALAKAAARDEPLVAARLLRRLAVFDPAEAAGWHAAAARLEARARTALEAPSVSAVSGAAVAEQVFAAAAGAFLALWSLGTLAAGRDRRRR